MSLRETLQADIADAMRGGQTLKRDTLRMALAALKNRAIDSDEDLSESDELDVITKAVKSRLDSVEQYRAANRQDLADKEAAEVEILRQYLPQQLDEAATRELVTALIEELEITKKNQLGKLMKTVMARHKGKVDGKLVQRIAAETLG